MKLSYPNDDDEVGSDEEERGIQVQRERDDVLGKFCRFVKFHRIEPD